MVLFGSLNSSNRKLSFRHVTATLSLHLRRFLRLKIFPSVLRGLISKKRRDQIPPDIYWPIIKGEEPFKPLSVDICVLHPSPPPFVWKFPDPSRETSFFLVFSALSSFVRSQ